MRQTLHKIVSTAGNACFFYKRNLVFLWQLSLLCRETFGYIIEYGPSEKRWLLLDQTNIRSKPVEIELRDISTPEQYLSRSRIVPASREQVSEGED